MASQLSQSPTPAGDSGYAGRERRGSSNDSMPLDTTPEITETDCEVWTSGKRKRTVMSTVEVNVPAKRTKAAIPIRATRTANGKGKGKKASQPAAKLAVPSDLGGVVAPEGLEEMTEAVDNDDFLDEEEEQNLTVVRNVTESCFLKGVAIPRLMFPKSQYEGFDFGMPIEKEPEVLTKLLKAEAVGADGKTMSEGDFSCFSLDRFTIYYPTCKRLSGEMTLLSNLNVHRGDNLLLFDGVLSDDAGESYYVEGVAFSILSVGNYEKKETHDVSGNIWIQTPSAKENNAWYELKNPSDEYSEYWETFVWLANLSKHVIDFLFEKHDVVDQPICGATDRDSLVEKRDAVDQPICGMTDRDSLVEKRDVVDQPICGVTDIDSLVEKRDVADQPIYGVTDRDRDPLPEKRDAVLLDFKSDFIDWLKVHHSESSAFQKWHAMYGKDDFRQAIAAHRDWLWNQAFNGSTGLDDCELWKEVRDLKVIAPVREAIERKTVVTPWVHECFDHVFGENLKKVVPPPKDIGATFKAVSIPIARRMKRDKTGNILRTKITSVEPGTVVALEREGTEWSKKIVVWYAYVHGIDNESDLGPELKVIWLYAHEDTILAKGKYPHHNELFFSDHCNCNEKPIHLSDLIGIVPVDLMVGPGKSGNEFFIRQKYRTSDPAFMTLTKADLISCACGPGITYYEEVKLSFQVGDTVLLGSKKQDRDILDPVMIHAFNDKEGMIAVRLFERKSRYDPKARPNEILWTPAVKPVGPEFIYRRCHVQFVSETDVQAGKIPAPYGRDGTGDCFIMSAFIDTDRKIKPYTHGSFPIILREGYRIDSPLPDDKLRMKGMDLFCGGGSFGRGLEEGGVVDMKWAVDIDVPAMATYRANLRNQDTALYLGSVNNYMEDAIRGKYSDLVPHPDEVDFISAGSPCQGFSNANQLKNNDTGLRNCSLVASVATALDVFRPRYALLENVGGLASTRKLSTGAEVNVFAQLVCCVVGMGYQIQQFTLDSWSFGSAQSRSRLFLSIVASGVSLPPRPTRSHDHGAVVRKRGLFTAPNGDKFGEREIEGPCPYSLITFKNGMRGLPNLGTGHVGACIPFPDHRHSRTENNLTRTLISHVPKFGQNRTWRKALDTGAMPMLFGDKVTNKTKLAPHCRSWSRLHEDGLCRTVTTQLTPQCAFTGTWVHPMEDRLITVMEARRAQSFPDDEVLLGNNAQAFKIVGNSVARSVALAWGISMRYAYLEQHNILRR